MTDTKKYEDIAVRLKDIRLGERNISPYGKQTLKEVEQFSGVDDSFIARLESIDNSPGMLKTLSQFAALTSYYEVSADYILGNSEIESVRSDISVAEKTTGLSSKAIKNLQSLNTNHPYRFSSLINNLLSSDEILGYLLNIYLCHSSLCHYKAQLIEANTDSLADLETLSDNIYGVKYKYEKIGRDIINTIEPQLESLFEELNQKISDAQLAALQKGAENAD